LKLVGGIEELDIAWENEQRKWRNKERFALFVYVCLLQGKFFISFLYFVYRRCDFARCRSRTINVKKTREQSMFPEDQVVFFTALSAFLFL